MPIFSIDALCFLTKIRTGNSVFEKCNISYLKFKVNSMYDRCIPRRGNNTFFSINFDLIKCITKNIYT